MTNLQPYEASHVNHLPDDSLPLDPAPLWDKYCQTLARAQSTGIRNDRAAAESAWRTWHDAFLPGDPIPVPKLLQTDRGA